MSIKSKVCSESSSSRLAKPEKWEFTFVNDHFEGKHNDEIGLYGQALISNWFSLFQGHLQICPRKTCVFLWKHFLRIQFLYYLNKNLQ